jgi:hypothetical protein
MSMWRTLPSVTIREALVEEQYMLRELQYSGTLFLKVTALLIAVLSIMEEPPVLRSVFSGIIQRHPVLPGL